MTHKVNSVSDSCCALTSIGKLLPLLFTWFVNFIMEASTILTQIYIHANKNVPWVCKKNYFSTYFKAAALWPWD
jgi:hypothetical protein